MTDYRLYFQNSAGHFVRAEDVAAIGDAEAVEHARGYEHAHPVEVWQRERKVGTVAPVRNAGWLSRLAFG